MPEWTKTVIWWQVYPLGFTGSPPSTVDEREQHRLRKLERWLDYAVELGASGLALGPIFASATHGYDTIDYLLIDPRLGDDSDFDALIAAAHARGLRVLLDGVFNHVGRGHRAFRSVLEFGPDAATASWFRLHWPRPWQPGIEPEYDNFEGHDQLVALNHAEPAVAEQVVAVMNHWLGRGADGWRLDAAYAVPTSFWASVLPRVRAEHPNAYIVGEVIHGDYAEIVRQSGMDSVTQYELWKAIWSSLNTGNFFELAWSLKRHNEFLDTFAPLTFVGNHDVTRLASKLTDERLLAIALVVFLTVGGTPAIYYGDEQAFAGVKEDRIGGDDAIRPEFPPAPGDLPTSGSSTFRLHQLLIGLRRRNAWLHAARTIEIHLTNTALSYESAGNGERLIVVLNMAADAVTIPAPGARGVLAGDVQLVEPGAPTATTDVPGFGWAVLSA